MFSNNDAQVIISTWLKGEHLEDIKLIPVDNFPTPYDLMAKHIRNNGNDLDKLYKTFKAKDVVEVLRENTSGAYGLAVHSVLKNEMQRTIPSNPSPEELINHATKYQRYWVEKPKPADLTSKYVDALEKRTKEEQILTGVIELDKLTYGIHKGQLTIVGARPSVGKSAFTLQVAFDVARKGGKVLFLPLEMSAEETVDRIVLRFGQGLDQEMLRTGKLEEKQRNEVFKVLDKIYEMKDRFSVYENVRELEAIKILIQEEKPDLVVIDQLSQIRNGDDFKTIREKYVEITRTLKAIALEEDVAIWLPCQMNRESSKSNLTSIDYLKESGSIEEDADIVIILSNVKDEEGNYKKDEKGRFVRMEIAKNRQGACGIDELYFVGTRFWFQNQVKGFVPDNGKENFDD